MKITDSASSTSIAEIGDGIYRISTPVPRSWDGAAMPQLESTPDEISSPESGG